MMKREGLSVAGIETCIEVPELRRVLDMGRCTRAAVQHPVVPVSHAQPRPYRRDRTARRPQVDAAHERGALLPRTDVVLSHFSARYRHEDVRRIIAARLSEELQTFIRLFGLGAD